MSEPEPESTPRGRSELEPEKTPEERCHFMADMTDKELFRVAMASQSAANGE